MLQIRLRITCFAFSSLIWFCNLTEVYITEQIVNIHIIQHFAFRLLTSLPKINSSPWLPSFSRIPKLLMSPSRIKKYPPLPPRVWCTSQDPRSKVRLRSQKSKRMSPRFLEFWTSHPTNHQNRQHFLRGLLQDAFANVASNPGIADPSPPAQPEIFYPLVEAQSHQVDQIVLLQ